MMLFILRRRGKILRLKPSIFYETEKFQTEKLMLVLWKLQVLKDFFWTSKKVYSVTKILNPVFFSRGF